MAEKHDTASQESYSEDHRDKQGGSKVGITQYCIQHGEILLFDEADRIIGGFGQEKRVKYRLIQSWKPEKEKSKCQRNVQDSLTLAFVKARSGIEAEPPFDIYFDKVWKEYHADENFNLAECKNKEFKRIVKNYSDRRLIDNDIFPILGISHGQFTKLKKEVGLSRTRK